MSDVRPLYLYYDWSMMLDSEIYRAMKDVLMEDGWTKHSTFNMRGERCVIGALAEVELRNQIGSEGSWANQGIWSELTRLAGREIIYWNDDSQRTIHEVLDLLDKAEKQALIREEIPG